MELEVSKKVREAIKAKLLELGCHVDDELPDYIMILIANRRSNQEIEGDLSLFLADNTKKFVGWLTHVLKKLEQVTAPEAAAKRDVKEKDPEEKPKEEISATIEVVQAAPEIEKIEKPTTKNDEVHVHHTKENKSIKIKRRYSFNEPNDSKLEDIKRSDESNNVTDLKTTTHKENILAIKRHEVNHLTLEKNKKEVKSSKVHTIEDSHGVHDTLILDSGENEFDNLDELRRIALESQEKKRKNPESSTKDFHQRKLITNILMGQKEKQSKSPPKPSRPTMHRTVSSRVDRSPERSSSRSNAKEESASRFSAQSERIFRILRSPRRQEKKLADKEEASARRQTASSVFNRIGPAGSRRRSTSRSKSRSRSPPRKLSSKIVSVIRRSLSPSEEDHIVSHSLSSVIKVTERPKRDLHLSNKMLLRAVADAQQSIIKTEQNCTKPKSEVVQETVHEKSKKRRSDENMINMGAMPKRRFSEFPEVNTPNFYEPQDAATRRKSVKERLGVKREIRRPVKERLGIIEQHHPPTEDVTCLDDEYDMAYSPANDYHILINVSDTHGANGNMRNVMLAANESKRISIQVNNSEESSDESDAESDAESSPERKESMKKKVLESSSNGQKVKENSDVEFELDVLEEDKLPEVPNEADQVEYEYEEILEEEDDSKIEHNITADSLDFPSQTSTTDSQEPSVKIIINKVLPSPPVSMLKSNLPDLRTKLGLGGKLGGSAPAVGMNGTSALKCKYWPKCQFNDKCIYEHPKCRFNPCKNKDCVYKHDKIIEAPVAPPKLVCKFYPKCTSMNCKFHHPSPCRFGVGCTAPRCDNYHPGTTIGMQKLQAKGIKVLPQANQLKWVKKTD